MNEPKLSALPERLREKIYAGPLQAFFEVPIPLLSVLDRLNTNIKVDPDKGCWNWIGFRNPAGYGITSVKGYHPNTKAKNWLVHRVVWRILKGPLPDLLHHKCENHACCNPEHLEACDGNHDHFRNHHQRIYCKNGHILASNFYLKTGGGRQCSICVNRARRRQYRNDPEKREATLKRSRKYYQEHKEQYNVWKRAYRAKRKTRKAEL